MTTQIIVVENLSDWPLEASPEFPVVHADEYLTNQEFFRLKGVQVINLCRSYRYLSTGYYCSLLAEARRHRVIPSVKTMLDLSSKSLYSVDAENLDSLVQRSLEKSRRGRPESGFEMEIFFGRCRLPGMEELARQLFEKFPCPLLRAGFRREQHWQMVYIKAPPVNRLDDDSARFLADAFSLYQTKRWRMRPSRPPARYDLAILHNPTDAQAPSDRKALRNFIRAGAAAGVAVELIERKDYARVAEYDALFIRDTTRINHYTYRFAKKAESEGMVVIDDPQSILRCTNKVFLAELLRAKRVPTPRTVIAGRPDLIAAEEAIGYPMVLKVPDGSFSQGVVKAENREQMREMAARLLKTSELILAQEFLYTDFDWRIGILNRKPLFACQYFMSKHHWQIVNYDASGRFTEGTFKTWPVEDAPKKVVEVALKAANLIGDGLYGVDLKQRGEEVFVIEINDNPNIESGVEDAYLKDELYRIVVEEFVRRMDLRHRQRA